MKVAQILATDPRRAAAPPTPRSCGNCRPTRPRWAGCSCAAAWRASSGPRWQERFAGLRAEAAAARGLARPGPPRDRAGRHAARLQAAIPGHGRGRGGRPQAVAPGAVDLPSATTGPMRPARASIPGIVGNRLREELDYYREAKHIRLYAARCWPAKAGVHGAGARGCAFDRPPAHHDLARRALAAGVAPRTCPWRRATGWRRTCSAPGTCPFYDYGVIHGDPHLGNYSMRGRISASTCWTSAASGCSRRPSSRA